MSVFLSSTPLLELMQNFIVNNKRVYINRNLSTYYIIQSINLSMILPLLL